MKKSAVKAGLVVLVLVAVVLWTFLSNYFRGELADQEVQAPASTSVSHTVVVSSPVTVVSVSAPTSVPAVISAAVVKTSENLPNSPFCKAQFQEILRIPSGKVFREALEKNPAFMDKNCFAIPTVKGMDIKSCTDKPSTEVIYKNSDTNRIVAEALCDAFLTYYKFMLTDYFYTDVTDIKNMPEDILRAKLIAQFVARLQYDDELQKTLADEVLRRAPNQLKALKLYLIAQYLLPVHDFSNKGPVYSYITKAYKLAPQDKEIQKFVAYSVMVSEGGLFKLTELEFLRDDYYAYYFYAWFHWIHKSSLEKTKLHLATGVQKSVKYKYLFEKTLKEVNDKKVVFGQLNIFDLDFELMPEWDSL